MDCSREPKAVNIIVIEKFTLNAKREYQWIFAKSLEIKCFTYNIAEFS